MLLGYANRVCHCHPLLYPEIEAQKGLAAYPKPPGGRATILAQAVWFQSLALNPSSILALLTVSKTK